MFVTIGWVEAQEAAQHLQDPLQSDLLHPHNVREPRGKGLWFNV